MATGHCKIAAALQVFSGAQNKVSAVALVCRLRRSSEYEQVPEDGKNSSRVVFGERPDARKIRIVIGP